MDNNNNLILVVLILGIGLAATLYLKVKNNPGKLFPDHNIIQKWNDWSNDKPAPEQDKLPAPGEEWPDGKPYPPPIAPNDSPEQELEDAPMQSYAEALDAAKVSGKKLMLYFTADWCGNCEKMKETFDDPTVQKALGNFIKYTVNVDNEKEIAKKYNIHGIPAYCIIDGNERVLKNGRGLKSPKQFVNWLGH